jgi:hypothetical protein
MYFVSFKEEYWAPNRKASNEIGVVATLVSFYSASILSFGISRFS